MTTLPSRENSEHTAAQCSEMHPQSKYRKYYEVLNGIAEAGSVDITDNTLLHNIALKLIRAQRPGSQALPVTEHDARLP